MPVKKRNSKLSRFPEMKLRELMYGPGSCLLAGEGYEYSRLDGPGELTAAQRAEMLAEMNEDWELHRTEVLAAWAARDETELRLARDHHGNPRQPWAARFDTPRKEKNQ